MAFESSALYNEVAQVLGNGATAFKYYHWTMEIVANGATYTATKVISIDVHRNYVGNYTDEVMVSLMLSLGTYEHLILPYKDNLLCTLKGTPVGEVSSETNGSKSIPSQQMRGTLVSTRSDIVEGNDPDVQDLSSAYALGMKKVQIQLVDKSVEQLRMVQVGNIYRNTTPGNALKTIMTSALSAVKLAADEVPAGVNMTDPDNTTSRDHVIIPDGTTFMDVPDLIHNHCGGIYSTGFGFYLQNAMWHVYPTHNIKNFDKASKSITFVNVPKNRYMEMERTFRATGGQVIVLVTGQTQSKDVSEHQILNGGNGVRYTDASKMMDGFGVAKNNTYTASRAASNSEYMVEARDTGYNNVKMAGSRITSNGYTQMSEMAKVQGRHVQVTWEHSDPSLIEPGTPCKYMYLVNDKVQEAEGCIQSAHSYSSMKGSGISSDRHVCKTVVTLFLDKAADWATDEPDAQQAAMASTSTSTTA